MTDCQLFFFLKNVHIKFVFYCFKKLIDSFFFVPEWFEELPCGLPDFFLNSSWVGVYLKSYKVDIHSIVWLKNMWDNYWCWWLQQFTKHNFLNIEFIEEKKCVRPCFRTNQQWIVLDWLSFRFQRQSFLWFVRTETKLLFSSSSFFFHHHHHHQHFYCLSFLLHLLFLTKSHFHNDLKLYKRHGISHFHILYHFFIDKTINY